MSDGLQMLSAIGKLVAGNGAFSWDWSDSRLVRASDTLVTAVWPAANAADKARHAADLAPFEAAHDLNAVRNADLRRQIEAVGICLNRAGIVPVLLKGASHLATDLWPTPGSRLLADLDLLVPQGQLQTAHRTLLELAGRGAQAPGHPELVAQHKHLLPVVGAGGQAPVELHHAILPEEARALAPAEDIIARSEEIVLGQARLRVPAPTDRVLIAMLHGPAGGGTYLAPMLQMRDLLDIRFLAARHGDRIDWDWLERHLAGAGWSGVLEITNRCLVRFTGYAPPVRRCGPVARLDAARWVWQLDHPRSRRVGLAANLARYTLRSLARGGEPRRRAIRYLGQPETYRRAYRRYVLGRSA
ncbi:nucleotidyltransferase family protein [Rhodovulum marinum]|uniref:Putative nucleotidyltransferase-like protein n=1 Tax=Rhodovulum marinum TaxID=320662 RepID=A0A4R2PYJ2_9RHOB|nr:nucleotidyltransferase family protein [Rhodovulum marinum]TCP39281.1 putative nucleotidyltransferase-like protein [Rhodovulum marinum]